jgi:hypothetical protein
MSEGETAERVPQDPQLSAELAEKARVLKREADRRSRLHDLDGEIWGWFYYLIGVPAALLAASAGANILFGKNSTVSGVLALLAAALTALLTALNPAKEASGHREAAASYDKLKNDADFFSDVIAQSGASAETLVRKYEALAERKHELDRKGPPVSSVVGRLRARRRIRHKTRIALIALPLVVIGGYFGWGALPQRPQVDIEFVGDADPPADLTLEERWALLNRFAPILYFAPDEYWQPAPIGSFVVDARVEEGAGDHWDRARDFNPPTSETLPRGSGYRLNLTTCSAKAGPECYEEGASELSDDPIVVYGRVWRNDSGADREVGYVVQYWLFYYFDDWRNSQTDPTMWQTHEGDWEQAAILISRERKPLFAAYSQHCIGHFRHWENVLLGFDDHPRIFVGLGSHANFFQRETPATPKKCLPPAARPLVDAYHLSDRTGLSMPAGPGTSRPIEISNLVGTTRWLPFSGPWGEDEWIFYLPNRGHRRPLKGGLGPVGPQQKRLLWTNPVYWILHEWTEDPSVKRSS